MESHWMKERRVTWSDLHFSKITPAVVLIARIISTLSFTNFSNNLISCSLPINCMLCISITFYVSLCTLFSTQPPMSRLLHLHRNTLTFCKDSRLRLFLISVWETVAGYFDMFKNFSTKCDLPLEAWIHLAMVAWAAQHLVTCVVPSCHGWWEHPAFPCTPEEWRGMSLPPLASQVLPFSHPSTTMLSSPTRWKEKLGQTRTPTAACWPSAVSDLTLRVRSEKKKDGIFPGGNEE